MELKKLAEKAFERRRRSYPKLVKKLEREEVLLNEQESF